MPYQLKKLLLYSALVHFSIVLIMFLNPKLFHLHFPHKEKITWMRLSKGMGNSPYSYKKYLKTKKGKIKNRYKRPKKHSHRKPTKKLHPRAALISKKQNKTKQSKML